MNEPPFVSSKIESVKMGLSLFDQSQFWDCHEALEKVWKDEADLELRLFLWVVIQVSGSLVLLDWKRVDASSRLFNLAKEKANRLLESLQGASMSSLPPRGYEFLTHVRDSDIVAKLRHWKFEL